MSLWLWPMENWHSLYWQMFQPMRFANMLNWWSQYNDSIAFMKPLKWYYICILRLWTDNLRSFKHSSFEIQFLAYIFIYPLFHSVLLSCNLGIPYGDLFSHGCKFSVIWWFIMGCKFWHILVVLSKLTKIKWYR